MINTCVWRMLLCACLWLCYGDDFKQEIQWVMGLVPGHQGKLGRQLVLDEVKSFFQTTKLLKIVYLVRTGSASRVN